MINALKPRSIAAQVAILIAAVLAITSAALVFLASVNSVADQNRMIDAENEHVSLLANDQLALRVEGLTVEVTETPEHTEAQMTWAAMPRTFDPGILDSFATRPHEIATLFRLDEATGTFIRVATTILTDGGTRAIGTRLEERDISDLLLSGSAIHSRSTVDGTVFASYFQPILDASGRTVGALAIGQDITNAEKHLWENLLTQIGISLAITLSLLFLSTWVLRWMMKPLSIAERSITNLANGTLDAEIGFQERTDEIGDIFKGLKVLQGSMQEATDLQEADAERTRVAVKTQRDQTIVVDALSKGLTRLARLDLTTQIDNTPETPFPAEYEALRTSFNMLVDNISETVEAIKEVADEVNSDAREIASSSQDLSSRTESQAATLEESAAALEELSSSVQSTAANASDAENNTNENRTVAKRTGEIVETAISAMTAIEDSSQKITQIISVIDDIAFQTNLLALNAGVEAARAGEAGRGFAVVASEVRALAQHSSASAQEIKSLIASSSEHVENGSKLVRDAGTSIEDIIDRVDRVAGLVSDIAVSAKEQSIGVTEINTGVRELDSATQRNAAMAEEASAASESMNAAADRLQAQLARFQVANAPSQTNWAAAAADRETPEPLDLAVGAEVQVTHVPSLPEPHVEMQSQEDVFRDF